jgi:hypothetical protein
LPESVSSARIPGVFANLSVVDVMDWLMAQTILGWLSLAAVGRACMVSIKTTNCLSNTFICSGFKFSQLEMSEPRS